MPTPEQLELAEALMQDPALVRLLEQVAERARRSMQLCHEIYSNLSTCDPSKRQMAVPVCLAQIRVLLEAHENALAPFRALIEVLEKEAAELGS